MSSVGWVVIVPDDDVAEVARELLSLADHPRDVRTVRGGREFLVAPYVADRFDKPKRVPRARRSKDGG